MASTPTIEIKKGYSTDINLFKIGQPDPNATSQLTVGTSAYVRCELTGVASLAAGVRVLQNKVSYDTPTDEVATSQPYVKFESIIDPDDASLVRLVFTVLPSAPLGETYCRVAYDDGVNYTNIMLRITVHQSLKRFWLGNRRVTLFNTLVPLPPDGYLDERSLVVYAECSQGGTATALANLSGNSYLTYDSSYPGITSAEGLVSATLPPSTVALIPQKLGEITIKVGTQTPAPRPGTAGVPTVPIYVKSDTGVARPVLRKYASGLNKNSTQKLKLLVLFEGFAQKDKSIVDGWLNFIKTQMTSTALHAPYNRLVDSIDIWTADLPSEDSESGITNLSPISAAGFTVPAYPVGWQVLPDYTYDTLGNLVVGPSKLQKVDGLIDGAGNAFYDVQELLQVVGLPVANEPAPGVVAGRWLAKYMAKGKSNIHQFTPTKVSLPVFDAWRSQVPDKFLYAKDTIFNVIKGARRTLSSSVSKLTRGDWAVGDYLPTYPQYETDPDSAPRYRAILQGLTHSASSVTGKLWAPDSKDPLAASVVCFIVNDPVFGALTVPTIASYSSAGSDATYTLKPSTIPLTDAGTPPRPGSGKSLPIDTVAVFVHELGHVLRLGDEYGNDYNRTTGSLALSAPAGPPALELGILASSNVDNWSNLVSGLELQSQNIASLTTNSSGRITGQMTAPYMLRWNWDRTELAGRLLAAPRVLTDSKTGAKTTQLMVAALPGQNWKLQEKKQAVLREQSLDASVIRPTSYQTVTLTKITLVPNPTGAAYYTLEVPETVTASTAEAVLYKPRYYPDAPTVKMRLIAEKVSQLMKTTGNFKVTADPVKCGGATQATQSPTPAFVKALQADLVARKLAKTSNFSYNIIGLYEGGGEYDCGAYRANGQSKMRNISTNERDAKGIISRVYRKHNYVAQYYLVNKINPDKLAELDLTYDQQTH